MGRLIRVLIALLGFILAFRVFRVFIAASASTARASWSPGSSDQRASNLPSPSLDKREVLDLNQASVAQLCGLSGIGPAMAKKIVQGRPYKRKTELVQRGIVPQGMYDRIKKRLAARQT